jgi:hypothetical protein
MIHALVLAGAIGTTPPRPAGFLFQTHTVGSCTASIDPRFVRYVRPPRRDSRNPLLWLIGPNPTDQATAHAAPPATNSTDCLRSLQVRNER